MKHYTFVDYATQAYIAFVGLIVLLFHGPSLTTWPWLLLAHGVGLALVHGLIQLTARFPANRLLDFLRHYYPIPFFIAFYSETELLNQLFIQGYLDVHFLRLEQWLFGLQPGLEFMVRFPSPWLAELLYAAYFSFYIMIAGVGLALLLRDRRQFAHFISVISFMLYVCYLTYIFLPVVGPRIVDLNLPGISLPHDALPATNYAVPKSVERTVFFRIMGWFYDHFESAGAAFPSSHVAVAIGTVYFSFLYLRRIRHIHLLTAILLCVSTVYGRYHYVVDVAAGIVTAAVLIPLGNWLYFKFANRDRVFPADAETHEGAKDRALPRG
jgi:membrane-associated phospholipid phosphatase